MRLPWVQVAQESFAKARMLAGLLGVSRREAMGLLVDLWAWALDQGPADQPPTGELIHDRAGALLAAALEWPPNRTTQLISALEDIGVLEVFGQGLRVRGMDRYHATWRKNRRHPPGTRPASGVEPDGTSSDAGGQTQTQTQTHIKQLPPTRAREEIDAPHPISPPAELEAPDLRERLEATYQRVRSKPYRWGKNDDPATRELPLAEPGEICRRFELGLKRVAYPRCNSVADLAAHWNAYATDEPQSFGKGRAPESAKYRSGEPLEEKPF